MPQTYRVAVIGRTGRGDYGHGLDVVWKSIARAELVAVADDDKTGLAAATRRLGIDRGYSDYRRMLDEVRPQIVSIAPRWIDQHAAMIAEAASRGTHIYIEKPLCRTLAEADAIVAACERSHVKLAIAYQTRYSPKLPVVKSLIDSGRIGRVLEYRARGKEDARGGGEDLWVLGGHLFNLMRYFAGDASWCLGRVARGGQPIRKTDVAEGNEGIGPLAGDQVSAMYGLADGQTGFFASRRAAGSRQSRYGLQIFGTAGVLEIQTGWLPSVKLLDDPSWSPGRSGAAWQDVSSAGVALPEPRADGGLAEGNVAAVNDLIDAIEQDRQPLANVYEARAVTEMIVAPFESQRLGALATIPLANRENPLAMLA